MNFTERLSQAVSQVDSHLCVGLDIDPARLTTVVKPTIDDLKNYTRLVIDATMDFASVYKLNFAFFEQFGADGFRWLEETVKYIDNRRLTIADAKRGDIFNSAKQYANAIFNHFGFDSVTVSPYMGSDSISPFIENPEKGVFVLCLTSNDSAKELQLKVINGKPLYAKVIEIVNDLNSNKNCGLVIGATREDDLVEARQFAGDLPFLIPGVGAQGGDLKIAAKEGNRNGIAIINVSRNILYAGDQSADAIRLAAKNFNVQINNALTN